MSEICPPRFYPPRQKTRGISRLQRISRIRQNPRLGRYPTLGKRTALIDNCTGKAPPPPPRQGSESDAEVASGFFLSTNLHKSSPQEISTKSENLRIRLLLQDRQINKIEVICYHIRNIHLPLLISPLGDVGRLRYLDPPWCVFTDSLPPHNRPSNLNALLSPNLVTQERKKKRKKKRKNPSQKRVAP